MSRLSLISEAMGSLRRALRGALVLAASLWVLSSNCQADDTVVIGGVDFPPISFVDEDAHIHGPGVDSVNVLFDQLNRPYRWIGLSQNRLYREIERGGIDLTFVTKKGNLYDEALTFTHRPITCLSINIYNSPYMPRLSKLSDLKGKRLLYLEYFEAEDLLKELAKIPDIELSSTNHRSSAMVMLKMARTDYYLDFRLPASIAMKEAKANYDYLTIREEPVYLAAVSSKPGAPTLIKELDTIIDQSHFQYQPPDKGGEAGPCSEPSI